MSDTITVVIAAHPARARGAPPSRFPISRAPLLQQAIASAWSQSLLPDAMIVAMDNEGLGAPATRARALGAVATDWVAFLDSDDLFLPAHLEALLGHALETGADYVYSWFHILQNLPSGAERVIDWDAERGDGVFPPTHFTNDFDPADPIETTITVLVRAELAKAVGMRALADRVADGANTGEDRAFTLDCLAAGAKISHLREFTWLWRHHWDREGGRGNTSGRAGQGDGMVRS